MIDSANIQRTATRTLAVIDGGPRKVIDTESGPERIAVPLQRDPRKEIGMIQGVVRAKRPARLPVVLTKEQILQILEWPRKTQWLMAILLYGAGLRLIECCRLRVKDMTFHKIRSWSVQVKEIRIATRCSQLQPRRSFDTISKWKRQHEHDLKSNMGRVTLPDALERKYPKAGEEWGWQWVFPATRYYTDRVTDEHFGTIFTRPYYKRP